MAYRLGVWSPSALGHWARRASQQGANSNARLALHRLTQVLPRDLSKRRGGTRGDPHDAAGTSPPGHGEALWAQLQRVMEALPSPAPLAPTAQAVLSRQGQYLLDGHTSVFAFFRLVERIENHFDFPPWLGDLANACDWCDPASSFATHPHLYEDVKRHLHQAGRPPTAGRLGVAEQLEDLGFTCAMTDRGALRVEREPTPRGQPLSAHRNALFTLQGEHCWAELRVDDQARDQRLLVRLPDLVAQAKAWLP